VRARLAGPRCRNDINQGAIPWLRGTLIVRPLICVYHAGSLSLSFFSSFFVVSFFFFAFFFSRSFFPSSHFLFFLSLSLLQDRTNTILGWILLRGAHQSPPHLDFCVSRHQKSSVRCWSLLKSVFHHQGVPRAQLV
jgi:hypothetical protein